MKKTIAIALMLSALNAQADPLDPQIKEFLNKHNAYCENVSDIQEQSYGNIKIYNIVCDNDNGSHTIYQFVPEQFVQTYYLEK